MVSWQVDCYHLLMEPHRWKMGALKMVFRRWMKGALQIRLRKWATAVLRMDYRQMWRHSWKTGMTEGPRQACGSQTPEVPQIGRRSLMMDVQRERYSLKMVDHLLAYY